MQNAFTPYNRPKSCLFYDVHFANCPSRKNKRFGPKIFSEVNQVKLTFSRGQSPRVSPLLITLTLARSP